MSPIPPSPKSPKTGTPKHSPLHKAASIYGDHSAHPLLQKSMSVGYTPDFLDSDIDAIIDKLTVQPPPTDDNTETRNVDIVSDEIGIDVNSERLEQSWNGTVNQNGLDYENPQLSHTVDMGVLALEDQYSSLVIPPPPDESKNLEEIHIVPPVASVKERRKQFENGNSKVSEMSQILKQNMKSASYSSVKSEVGKTAKQVDTKNTDSNSRTSLPQSETSVLQSGKKKLKDSSIVDTAKSEANTATNDKTESPASVSEKLNELLQSLAVYDAEEEDAGRFRRTSSLRLGRCSSLDFLPTDTKTTNKQNSTLQTGSVRLKPMRTRPSLSLLERPVSSANVGSKFQIGSEPITVTSGGSGNTAAQNNPKTNDAIPRTRSYDALPQEKKKGTSGEKNDSFASLKAKLQLCRDTLLNRSLRKRSGSADRAERASLDGDAGERKSSLTRSNSFSHLFRRSGRSSKSGSSSGQGTNQSSNEVQNSTSPVSSARDLKILNTLTTPRSNFRPNTGPMQVQVSSTFLESKVFPMENIQNVILKIPIYPNIQKS